MRVIQKKRIEDAEKLCKAVKEYFDKYHYAPTVRELCRELDLTSTSSVAKRLISARELGYIDFSDGVPRTIVLKHYDYKLEKKDR